MEHGTQLQSLIDREAILVCPGVHDPLTARAADQVGFDALYMTGSGTALSTAGLPDAGLVTMPEMVDNGKHIQATASVPVICDADTGYGNALSVVRTVREFAGAGVAGIHIEDQVAPKRCGFAAENRVIPKAEAEGKFRAAADERDRLESDLRIIARTDARRAENGSLEAAIERANAYVAAGADVAFVEGPKDRAELEQIGEAVDAPLLYNCVGDSPRLEPVELERLGVDVVIYPLAASMAAIKGALIHFQELAAAGREESSTRQAILEDEFASLPVGSSPEDSALEQFFEFSGFDAVAEQERQYLPVDEDTG